MGNAVTQVKRALELEGTLGAPLADAEGGLRPAPAGGDADLDLEPAAAGTTELLRAQVRTIAALRADDTVDDILVSLGKTYHLLRPLRQNRGVFFYLVLDRARANLALARRLLAELEAATQL